MLLRLSYVDPVGALVVFTNVLSTFWYQYQIEYHYSLVAVPALAIGTVYAIGEFRDRSVALRGQTFIDVAGTVQPAPAPPPAAGPLRTPPADPSASAAPTPTPDPAAGEEGGHPIPCARHHILRQRRSEAGRYRRDRWHRSRQSSSESMRKNGHIRCSAS